MANIKAFKGYVFNQDKIDDLGKVMSSPYNFISPDEQKNLYELHENNTIRLSTYMNFNTDTTDDNPYTRAAGFVKDLIKKDILVQDKEPTIYLYEQELLFNKITFKNTGFVALLELDDAEKTVVPCESVSETDKSDRYKLMSHVKANFNMINCMYIESEKYLSRLIDEVRESSPDISFTIPDGTKERIWRITDPAKISFIADSLKPHTVYITDGQNRYEMALRYRNNCRKNNPNHTGKESYNYIMTLLTNTYDDGMVHTPFHRLVKFSKPFNESFFIAACQDNFKVEKIIVDTDTSEFIDTIKKQIATTRHENKIALYCGGEYFYRLILKDSSYLKSCFPEKSDAYLSLDVTVLNKLILEDILNITKDDYDDRITYTKSVTEGVRRVRNKEFGCLLAINPVKAEQIREVALSGDKMPSHSICVFPKPATGVIINVF
ncbi:MAG: DUF1015 domain-containing protein [Firmicutes bacterium]|nr:DUF1015 domain-containing protein [Bacillota bacterium]